MIDEDDMGKSLKVAEALNVFRLYLYYSFNAFSACRLIGRAVDTSEWSMNDADGSVYYLSPVLFNALAFFFIPDRSSFKTCRDFTVFEALSLLSPSAFRNLSFPR